ncbi:hypothetical protein RJT34_19595 [Clitoria ternatea]|uniref:Uncharacterized protein n=1 Tax=Clitoria ternatea TaxID=43366 RepID=A0AAN9IRC8_CLITE
MREAPCCPPGMTPLPKPMIQPNKYEPSLRSGHPHPRAIIIFCTGLYRYNLSIEQIKDISERSQEFIDKLLEDQESLKSMHHSLMKCK